MAIPRKVLKRIFFWVTTTFLWPLLNIKTCLWCCYRVDVFCGDFQVATLVFPYILTLHHHIHYLTSLTFSENGCVLSKFLELVQIFHCCDSDLEIWRTCSSCKNPTWLLWKVLKANYFWIYKECVKVLHPKISNFIDFWLI